MRVLAGLPFAIFLALAIFAYPQTDDWHLRNTALHSGVIGGAWTYLMSWGGRFVVAPFYLVIAGLPLPDITFPLAIAANIALVPWSARRLLPAATPHPWPVAIALSGLLFVTMPSTAQGLYWLAGMLAYVFPLHLFAWAVPLARPEALSVRQARLRAALLVAIGVAISGFGETEAILAGGSALILASFPWPRAWWLVAGVAVGLAIDLALPGNWARLGVVHPQGPVLSAAVVGAAIQATAQVCAKTVTNPACIGALLISAVAGAQAAKPDRPLPRPWLAPLVPFMVCAAILPSLAALGVIEGRQANPIWFSAMLWTLAGAWWLGCRFPACFVGESLRPGMVAGGAGIVLALYVAWPLGDNLGTVLIGFSGLAVAAWALAMSVLARRTTWLGVMILGIVAVNGAFQTAVVDLAVHAPARRDCQARRDAQVRALAAAGAHHVRFPLANPDDFPATIAVGDILGAGRWDSQDYAGVFGLDSAGADPRLDHAIATDANGHPLPPGILVPTAEPVR